MKKYEFIEHTADIGLKVYGKNKQELFINSALGLCDTIADVEKVESKKEEKIKVEAENIEELLVGWLSELLFKFDVDNMLYSKFEIEHLKDNFVSARIYGEKADFDKHNLKTEIKAITYHGLEIRKEDGMWIVKIIFDI